jgi:glutamate synthase (NADPH/NADH) small chain
VYRQDWKNAIETLHSTNNFPSSPAASVPAPCEEACVLRINEDPVGIKSIEHAIIDKAWEEGWVRAQPAPTARARRSPWWVRARPGSPARSSSRARATT